jgi:hypothetical protein
VIYMPLTAIKPKVMINMAIKALMMVKPVWREGAAAAAKDLWLMIARPRLTNLASCRAL